MVGGYYCEKIYCCLLLLISLRMSFCLHVLCMHMTSVNLSLQLPIYWSVCMCMRACMSYVSKCVYLVRQNDGYIFLEGKQNTHTHTHTDTQRDTHVRLTSNYDVDISVLLLRQRDIVRYWLKPWCRRQILQTIARSRKTHSELFVDGVTEPASDHRVAELGGLARTSPTSVCRLIGSFLRTSRPFLSGSDQSVTVTESR